MTLPLTKKHSFDLVFDGQKVFRLILEAMSNPAKVVHISEYAGRLYGNDPGFLAVAMTLLDNETSFHSCGNPSLADEIASLTLAKKENIDAADFVFVFEAKDIAYAMENAKRGTPSDPHKSATLIIRNDGAPVCRLRLCGPGIDGQAEIPATAAVKDAVSLRDARSDEYPQGIDLIFLSTSGDLFAIPRLTRMEVR